MYSLYSDFSFTYTHMHTHTQHSHTHAHTYKYINKRGTIQIVTVFSSFYNKIKLHDSDSGTISWFQLKSLEFTKF